MATVLGILAGTTLPGQAYSRVERHFNTATKDVVVSWKHTGDVASISFLDDSVAPHDVAIGMDLPGDLYIPQGKNIIFVGRKTATDKGLVITAKPDTSGKIAVVGTHEFAGADLVGVAFSFSTSRLYVLDAKSGTIFWASYTLGGAPSSAWAVLSNASSCAELGAQERIKTSTLQLEKDGLAPQLAIQHRRIPFTDRLLLTHEINGAVSKVSKLGISGRRATWIDEALTAGSSTLRIHVEKDGVVSLERLDIPGLPSLASLSLTPGKHAINLNVPLELGGIYGLRVVSVDGVTVAPTDGIVKGAMTRTGAIDPGPNFTAMPDAFPDVQVACGVGQAAMFVPLSLTPTPGQTVGPARYSAQLSIGGI